MARALLWSLLPCAAVALLAPGRPRVGAAPRAATLEAPRAATLEGVTAGLGELTAASFAAALGNLSAVEGLKAIDAADAATRADLLSTSAPFAAVLERAAATDAPPAAVGALVGHCMARVKRAQQTPDDALLAALAPALLRARKDAECLGVVDAIRAKDAGAVRCGVVAACRLGDAARVRDFVDLALAGDAGRVDAILDDATAKLALKRLARAGDHRAAFALVDALPAERRAASLYHGAIVACGKSRPIKGKTAMLLWRRMKAEGVAVPRSTYNALLHAAQGSLTENATTALLAEMSARNVSLNVISYNIALNSLAREGRFGEVLALLETMESSAIAPTEVTFGTAINGAAKANNSAAAVALLAAQSKLGLPLGDPAFASALEACLRDPDGGAAAARAADVVDALAAADVPLKRRERIEALARAAVGRDRANIDKARLKRDEEILGMVLTNRQVEV